MTAVENDSKQDKDIPKAKINKYKQAPLNIYFLDTGNGFTTSQKEILALALHLKEQGCEPCICCRAKSALMKKAAELKLKKMVIIGANAKKVTMLGLLQLYFKMKRNDRVCLHSFSNDCLPLMQIISRMRQEDSTICLHSCFDSPSILSNELAVGKMVSWLCKLLAPKNASKKLPSYWTVPQKVVFPSKFLANLWVEFGLKPTQPVAIHTSHAHLKPQAKTDSKRYVFVALEPLEEASGIDVLLKAMSALWQHPALPEWEVRVMGSGSGFEKTLNEAQSLGVSSRLALLGEQKIEDVLEYAHVIISPNTGPQGNISSLMAAWSMGLPLICTTVSAHMEVANIDNAMILPATDPQRLAAAMIDLMNNPESMDNLSKLSSSMYLYANISRFLGEYSNLYTECVAKHGWVLFLQNKKEG